MDILYSSVALYVIFNEEINECIKYYLTKLMNSLKPKKKYLIPSKVIHQIKLNKIIKEIQKNNIELDRFSEEDTESGRETPSFLLEKSATELIKQDICPLEIKWRKMSQDWTLVGSDEDIYVETDLFVSEEIESKLHP